MAGWCPSLKCQSFKNKKRNKQDTIGRTNPGAKKKTIQYALVKGVQSMARKFFGSLCPDAQWSDLFTLQMIIIFIIKAINLHTFEMHVELVAVMKEWWKH